MTFSNPEFTGLWVATPSYGGVVTQTYIQSALALQMAAMQRNFPMAFDFRDDSLITRSRSFMVSRFLDNPAFSHMLFIDSDIGFTPEAVFRLIDAKKHVVGGIYPIKLFDWSRVHQAARDFPPSEVEARSLAYVAAFPNATNVRTEGGFAQASGLGAGFLLVHRSVFERLKARHPELRLNNILEYGDDSAKRADNLYALFECLIENGTYLSEDFAFCARCRDLGIEIWADLESRLDHYGTHMYRGDFTTQFRAHQPT